MRITVAGVPAIDGIAIRSFGVKSASVFRRSVTVTSVSGSVVTPAQPRIAFERPFVRSHTISTPGVPAT